MQASLKYVDSKLLKQWPPKQYWGPEMGSKFNIEVYSIPILLKKCKKKKCKKTKKTQKTHVKQLKADIGSCFVKSFFKKYSLSIHQIKFGVSRNLGQSL